MTEPAERDDPVAQLLAIYHSPAAQRLYDEAVTECEHALQTATLARSEGAARALVAAALLHDLGHLLAHATPIGTDEQHPVDDHLRRGPDDQHLGTDHHSRGADDHHQDVGSAWLRPHFGAAVAGPVALHVEAKRYLCAVEADYHEALSPSSVSSLASQGGPMDSREVAAFEADAHHEQAVALRRWDDRAKVTGATTATFEEFVSLLRSVLRTDSRYQGSR